MSLLKPNGAAAVHKSSTCLCELLALKPGNVIIFFALRHCSIPGTYSIYLVHVSVLQYRRISTALLVSLLSPNSEPTSIPLPICKADMIVPDRYVQLYSRVSTGATFFGINTGKPVRKECHTAHTTSCRKKRKLQRAGVSTLGVQYHDEQSSHASELQQRVPLHKTTPHVEQHHAILREHPDHVRAPRGHEQRSDRLPRARDAAQQSGTSGSRVVRAERPQADGAELGRSQEISIRTERQNRLLVACHLEV